MKTNTHDMDDLLVKQLTGEITPGEKALVQQWLAEDASNRRYFEHFTLIWEESVHLAAAVPVNEHEAWERFKQKVTAAPRKKTGLVAVLGNWQRIAAILVLLAGVLWLAVYLAGNSTGEIKVVSIQSQQDVKKDTLPDGSVVTLNKHSSINYPNRFTNNIRPVNLQGEAFFNVMPDTSKPFIIHVGDIQVEVVGTSFNIRSKGDTVEVIVETGIVRVTRRQQTVTLGAGEKTLVNDTDPLLQKQRNTDQLYNYYRSRKFICDNTPLWRLAEMLEEAYDVTIEFERPELRNIPITTTFNNESLNNIFTVISETLDISVDMEQDTIIIR